MKWIHITAVLVFLWSAPDVLAAGSISKAKSWGYQLQNGDPAKLAASRYDVIVMDYSRDGADNGAYTAKEIHSIKKAGKIVLAYLSIGEAEDYRFYWRSWWKPGNPVWLGPENPDWQGNYKVRYWHRGWWEAGVAPYLKRIQAAGFDGVYMDIIDAYWYWHEDQGIPLSFTASKMVGFVEQIAARARAVAPGFILCPQNGESIIDDVPTKGLYIRYLRAINAIGVEDLLYNSSARDRRYRTKLLARFAARGKKILNVEYVGKIRWNRYLHAACAMDYEMIPYAGAPDRELDELIEFPVVPCPN
jgi:cysteinyl-tRNA synthetase